MRTFVDLKESGTEVKNGAESISSGKVFIKELYGTSYPYCKEHGAMNKVSKDGIWRCLACNEGAWEINNAQ